MGRTARAFLPSCAISASIQRAGRIHESHGERDTQRLFRKHGLRLQVRTSQLAVEGGNGEPVTVPYLRITDYFQVLLKSHPRILFGGFETGPDAEHLCEIFWERFEGYHPEHLIYQHYTKEERKRIIPVAFHGDKGRGVNKTPLFSFSWEVMFGLPSGIRSAASKRHDCNQKRKVHGAKLCRSCSERAQDCEWESPASIPCHEECALSQPKTPLAQALDHNGRGNSLLSRFLVAAVPKKELMKNASIVPTLLAEVAENLSFLFHTGVQDKKGVVFRTAFVGTKGDFEFLQLDCGDFQRTYMNEGRIRSYPMCPECSAGEPQYPATCVADHPSWVQTLYRSLPWTEEPPLNRAPFSETKKPFLYKRDMFHTLKYGFCRDLCASILILLSTLQYFDPLEGGFSKALDQRLVRAYSMFSMWCAAEGHCPSLKKFTLANLHRKKSTYFPWLGGKGSDTVLCMMFLDFYLGTCVRELRQECHGILIRAMMETVRGGLDFIGILHSHPNFLPHPCAVFMHRSGLRLLRGYAFLANHALQNHLKLFSMRPKTHYFAHSLWDLLVQINLNHEWVCSPALWNCEANEDFVGRISRLSRRVSPRLAGQRVIDRYLVGVQLLFRRARV